ncbi:unnamed protein product [Rodentolepis nana]|uniref:Ald_Xan_dh_C2 domain-containing protein n=1 Tax=Rodentolepis nana TaxID=102285 RepID=A0A0R3TDQ8_RODNA|nr:unnamed protein product [Rodentolepis nana]
MVEGQSEGGLLPSEAASEAIRIALRQLSYGMEPVKVQPIKHKNSRTVHIGLTHEGVAEFTGSKRTHLYKWYVFLYLNFYFKTTIEETYSKSATNIFLYVFLNYSAVCNWR